MAEFPNPLGALAGRGFAPEAWLRAAGDPAPILFAWELARIPADLDARERRKLHLLLSLLLTAQAQGSTRLPLTGSQMEELHRAFGEAPVDWAAFLDDPRLEVLVGGPEAGRPLVRWDGALATRRLVTAEARVREVLRARAARPALSVAVSDAVLAAPVPLNAEQRTAVAAAAQLPLAVITGGPGTGKTSILAALLRTLLEAGLEPEAIVLAAPTGKAVQRMGEAVRRVRPGGELPEPLTLHRLLGWDPRLRRFRRDAENPLRVDVLVVDEASMIGLELMDALLAALPAAARLVLVGDADQLPSVEAGTVFRDLVAGLPQAVSRLLHSHRLDAADPGGRAILEAARAIGEGRGPDLPMDGGDPEAPGIRVASGDDAGLRLFLRSWSERRPGELPLLQGEGGGLDAASVALLERQVTGWEAARLLCLLREGGLRSVAGLNAHLHAERTRAAGPRGTDAPFLPGEPVLARRNDYGRGLFNGDQGIVGLVRRDGAPRLEALFLRPDGPACFPLDAIQGSLEHAYALTVHQAQGSEYDHIALVLPGGDHPLLTREILYTALTRARRSVAVLGNPGLLAIGAARPLQRAGSLDLEG
ncbi:ATP-dependent RecD-like DNA helicase [Geothrix sp. 21YS21S-4]|uniref:ATP-dependent DNA helicase n=1 Tax=Geothrix sp. 21YS21S-4 TaxID=3068889 RepID=UPI0027BA8901|nr:AAA family ATPase [Geothrix sp. 21YS21S-4]